MAGSPRFVEVTPVDDFDLIDAPDDVRAGDVILAWITTNGSLDDVDISGGNPWTPLAESTSQVNTRLYGTVAGTTNPHRYQVELGNGDRGLAGLAHLRGTTLADIVVEHAAGASADDGVPCPAADPGVAGGVEVRYAIGSNPLFDIDWFGGYPEEDQAGDGDGTSAYLGARTMSSSTNLPVREISAGFAFVVAWQAWTVIVTPADLVPPPPPLPAFAVKGRALYRYTCHDMKTGNYIDDLYPRDVEYTKKIREPGTFTGTLDVPNRRVAAAVRRIIPQVKADLTTGPGRVEIRVWRDGQLWGRYWLTGARLNKGRDGRVSIELRGSTLDGYWYSLAVAETLNGEDDEQIDNATTFLGFALDKDGAALANVEFQEGSSGVFRPFLVKGADNTSYGRAVEEYSKAENGFEYFLAETVNESGVVSTWVWASPRFDTGIAHVFSTSPRGGGDMIEYSADIDALQGGTDWTVRGGTIQPDPEEDSFPVVSDTVVTPHRDAGWPRIDHQVDHPTQSVDEDELNTLAEYYAEIAGGALWVRTVTVILPKRPTLTMNSLGDSARLLITDVWHESVDGAAGLDISERILEIRIRTTGRGKGREEATLTLESVEVP